MCEKGFTVNVPSKTLFPSRRHIFILKYTLSALNFTHELQQKVERIKLRLCSKLAF